MADANWPVPTPRDEVLARVVTRGRRIQMINRLMIGGAVAAAAAVTGVGVWLGVSGAVDLVGDDGAAPAVVVTPQGGDGDGETAAGVAYFACPNEYEVGRLHGGDRIYLTGRDDSGEWVALRSPNEPGVSVWVRAEVVDPDGDADLPEVDCEITEVALGATATTVPEELPDETTTTTEAEPTPTTTPSTPTSPPPVTTPTQPPTPTTAPTAPDTTGPSISDLQRTRGLIVEFQPEFCESDNSTVASAIVTDPAGVASVEARWSFTFGGTQYTGSKPMILSGGRFRAQIDAPSPPGSANQIVDINWSVRAVDGRGNVSTATPGPNSRIEFQGC